MRQLKIQTSFIPEQSPLFTLEAVLSHTPNSAPVRRFSFAGEQQDSDTAIRIVRPIFIETEMPQGSGSAI